MSILAKLTKGIQETMDSFVSQMRSNAGMHFCRLPGPYLSYITFQSALQEALSIYFQARKEWADGKQRGIAVSMMKTARAGLEVRSSITSKGIPEAINSSSSPLYVLRGELVSEPTATAMAPHAPTHTCAMAFVRTATPFVHTCVWRRLPFLFTHVYGPLCSHVCT